MPPNDPNDRTELELVLLESANVRQESESLREMVAKLLAETGRENASRSVND